MGFLDHSTNNIIVDAVLTDVGREKLASATSAENFVASYAFADDEIDYTLIKKYGTIVGKEKIEKNTPIFEASTNASLGVKYFLVTSANPLVAQPQLELTPSKTELTTANDEVKLSITTKDPEQLLNSVTYTISYDARFLSPVGTFAKSRVANNANRLKITINGTLDDQIVRFKRAAAGKRVLEQSGQTVSVQHIKVQSSASVGGDVYINISY